METSSGGVSITAAHERDSSPAQHSLEVVKTALFNGKESNSRSPGSDGYGAMNEVIYVCFEDHDQRNPVYFSSQKKRIITAIVCFFAFLGASTSTNFSLGISSMIEDLKCSRLQALAALVAYSFTFGLVPLVVAPFSEDFGRRPIYIFSGIAFALMFAMAALAQNIETVIVARLLQGAFGSPGAVMVGGTIADIWSPHERGLPMALFIFIGVSSTGLGPTYAGWIAMNPRLGWRWIQWIQMILCGVYLTTLPLLKETRSSVLLRKLAKQKRKETGDTRYRAKVEGEEGSLSHRIYISCTRPIRILLTEPLAISMGLWVAYAWGVVFGMIASITNVFRDMHGFNTGQTGTIYTTIIVGSSLGFVTNMYQETLYQKYAARRGPEARLHTCCFASIILPAGMLIYAWTSTSQIHWIAQVIGLIIFSWATMIMYLAGFSYVADCYGVYASSALAGQGLARNTAATVFPLFIDQLFKKLGYQWGNTLFALLAALMIPIPFVLYYHGRWIRGRSRFSRMVLETQELK